MNNSIVSCSFRCCVVHNTLSGDFVGDCYGNIYIQVNLWIYITGNLRS